MPPRQPIRWLMTDERMGEALWPALRALPPGSGVVFRHRATPPAERRRLLRRVERIAAARRLVLLVAGGNGRHGTHGGGPRPGSWPAHDRREAITGVRAGAAVLFVSPVYPTRSHQGAQALGPMRAAGFARRLPCPFVLSLSESCPSSEGRAPLRQTQSERRPVARPAIIALGGMDERRWRRIAHLGFDGWAAIDAWTARADQKRKIVPT